MVNSITLCAKLKLFFFFLFLREKERERVTEKGQENGVFNFLEGTFCISLGHFIQNNSFQKNFDFVSIIIDFRLLYDCKRLLPRRKFSKNEAIRSNK